MIGVSQILYKPALGWRKRKRIGMLIEYPEQKRTVLTTPVEQPLDILKQMQNALDDAYAAGIRNARREWVGLTDEQKLALCKQFPDHLTFNAIHVIEAKLKEKNFL